MTIVVSDAELRSRLAEVSQAELRDTVGNPIGHFISRELYHQFLLTLSDAHVTKEELDKAFSEPGGRSLPEIWSRLAAT